MAFPVVLQVPDWLNVKKQVVPDFVTRDPKKSPVWEISGAEFSKADIHTAGGISIRFPRITKFRDDKNWQNATDVGEESCLSKFICYSLINCFNNKSISNCLEGEKGTGNLDPGEALTDQHRVYNL